MEQAKLAFDIEPHLAEELVRIEEVFRRGGAAQEGVRAAEARAALLAEQGGPAEAVPAWFAVAELWKAQRRTDAAAAALDKVLELEPGNRDAYEQLRTLHEEAGNWRAFARVCDVFAPHLADPAEKVALLKEVAAIHEKRLGQKEMGFLAWSPRAGGGARRPRGAGGGGAPGRGDAGVRRARRRCWSRSPRTRAGWSAPGCCCTSASVRDEQLDEPEGAEAAYRRALEADPASPDALDALAQLYKRRGRVRELVITLEQKLEAAAGIDEKKATLVESARIYDGELHDVDEAVGALRRALELDGADPAALSALSALYRREHRWLDLAGMLARARDLSASDEARIAYQLEISALYENEIEDDEAAVEGYRTVLGLDDRNREALAGLERLYTKLDRFAELNRIYERQIALSEDPREQVRVLARSAAIHEEKLHDPRSAIEKNEAVAAPRRRERRGDEGPRAALPRRGHVGAAHHGDAAPPRAGAGPARAGGAGGGHGRGLAGGADRSDRAEAILNHALQLDPDSREAVTALGRLYERERQLEPGAGHAPPRGAPRRRLARRGRAAGPHGRDLRRRADGPGRRQGGLRPRAPARPGPPRRHPGAARLHERENDRDRFLELLVDEARYETDLQAKTERYTEAARVYQEERDDRETAVRYYEEALKRTPGHLPAALPLSDIYVSQARWADAERILDGIVDTLSAGGDAKELCRQSYRQGYVAEKLGNREKALAAYRCAYELDATYLPALEGLGNLLVQGEQWEEALRIYTTVLIHHRDGLTDLEVVETHWQIGEIAARLAQPERAANAFRKALEIDANHEPSRRSLVRVLEGIGDFEGAVEQRQRLLPLLEGEARRENFVAIGEACRDRLQDPYQAIDAFLGASREDPTLEVTEALLGLYRQTRQGQKAADVLAQIAARPEVEADPVRAAQLRLSLAEILRDEVKDEAAAVVELERALDRNPRLVQAFAALEEILARGRRWEELEQAYLR